MDFINLFKKSISAFFVRGLGALSMFLLNFILVKVMDLHDAGGVLFLISIVMILGPFFVLGLHQASLRFIGQYDFNEDDIKILSFVSFSRAVVFFSGLLFCLVLWFIIPYFYFLFPFDVSSGFVFKFLVASFLYSFVVLFSHELQALGRYKSSIFVLSISIPAFICLGILLLGFSSFDDVVSLYLLSCLIAAIIGYFLSVSFKNKWSLCEDRNLVLSCMFPLWIYSVMQSLIIWGGPLFAGFLGDADDVAFLSVSQRTANLISFVLMAVNIIVAPKFSAMYHRGDIDRLQSLVRNSILVMALISFPFAIVLLFFTDHVLSIYGEEFYGAKQILIVLTLGQIFNVVTGPVSILLIMCGFEVVMRNIVLFIAPLLVVLSFGLESIFGTLGIAIATCLCVIIQNSMAVYYVKKRIKIKIF